MIVGIGGCSNAGKSFLAREIIKELKEIKIIHLCQDDYVKYSGNLTKYQGHIDWELPSSIRINEYLQAVIKANNNYDIVLAEGLFAFSFEELYSLYDGKIFLSLDKNTFFKRKKRDNRWGFEPEWYIKYIWECHLKYGKEYLTKPFFQIDANTEFLIKPACDYIMGLKNSFTQ